jgi:hypothetical protein
MPASKAPATDGGLRLPRQRDGIAYVGASDEHGKFTLAGDATRLSSASG